MTTFKNILVATDFGAASREAAEVGCDLAAKLGGRVALMHVWTVPTPAYAESITLPLDRLQAAAEATLAREVDLLSQRYGKLDTILVPGVPWRAIVDAAQEHGFDLIVVGTHGRRGVPRMFLGSVAERVVRASPVPVLTVHAR